MSPIHETVSVVHLGYIYPKHVQILMINNIDGTCKRYTWCFSDKHKLFLTLSLSLSSNLHIFVHKHASIRK